MVGLHCANRESELTNVPTRAHAIVNRKQENRERNTRIIIWFWFVQKYLISEKRYGASSSKRNIFVLLNLDLPMFRIILLIAVHTALSTCICAQGVKIGEGSANPDPSSILELESSNRGFLPPRLSEEERDAMSNAAPGLLIFNTTTNCFNFRTSTGWSALCGFCTPETGVGAHPSNQSGCDNGVVQFTAAGSGNDLIYQWQVSTNGGDTWTDLTATAPYSGVHSAVLTLTNPSVSLTDHLYRARITGNCPPHVYTSAASLSVTSPPVAEAGTDQLEVPTPVTLNATPPVSGTGVWQILSGEGGSIDNPSSPSGSFSGAPGETYVLQWTVTNGCGSDADEMTVSISSSVCPVYSTWGHYRVIDVTNSSGTPQTLFQVPVVINHSALVSAGKSEANGSDIRVAAADCNAVDFWIDPTNLNTASCTIWVEVPSLPANATTSLYLFYKKTGESSVSNGPNTFVYFEDFSSGNLSGYSILTGGGSSWINSGNALRDNGVGSSGISGPTFSAVSDWVWEMNFQTPNPTALDCQFGIFDSGANGMALWFIDNATIRVVKKTQLVRIPDGTLVQTVSWPGNNSTHTVRLGKVGNDFSLQVNNNSPTNFTYAHGISTYSKMAGFGSSGSSRQMNYDNIRVRKNAAAFPTVSLGAEQ